MVYMYYKYDINNSAKNTIDLGEKLKYYQSS